VHSSADVEIVLAGAVDAVAEAAAGLRAPVILIDGRSGAGKTTVARALADRMPGAQLLALDSLYPGWDGLDAGVAVVLTDLLTPLSRGEHGAWRRWDWAHDRPAEVHRVSPDHALIVEGAGVLTPETARLADVTAWFESPASSRRDRALRRDGDGYRPHWERWAAQEDAHIARNSPQSLASIVVEVP
jgi:hypothetical protein